MKFSVTTDEETIDVSNITGEDILSAFNYQFTRVARTTNGELARYKKDTKVIEGVLTNTAWVTTNLESYALSNPDNPTEVSDITFAEFKAMMNLRFAQDSANTEFDGPKYDGITVGYEANEIVVKFPENFLKWNEIHGYNNNRYNITMHFKADKFAEMLAEKTGFEVTNKGANSSLKMQLQGAQGGTTDTPVNVVFESPIVQ